MSELLSLDAQRRLNFTQSTREKIARDLLKDDKLPESDEDRNLLLKVLDGMDRTDLSVAKLKVDDKSATGMQNIHDMVAHVLLNSTRTVRHDVHVIPELPMELAIIDMVPGETELGVQTFTYEDMIR